MADFVTGLDIGTSSIKAVVLSHKSKPAKLVAFGSIAAPQPGMISDADVDLETVASAIKNLLSSVKTPSSSVVVALPESKIFTRVVSDFPYLSDGEVASAIRYSTEEFVPLPADQVSLYWQVIGRSKDRNNTTVFVVASPKNTVSKYLRVLELAKLRPQALETELIAATRVLIGSNEFAPTTLIINFGANSTDFAVVSKGLILLTRSIATGGMALTRAIAQYLNFEPLQAEEYKKVYGLSQEQLGGKIHQALKPLVDIIVTESQRVIQSFQTKYTQNPVKRMVLSGGGAKMPGLVIYLANNLGMEVQEADPWASIQKDRSIESKLEENTVQYVVAVGLALREG
ncbi:MAG: type IV pilus assembly protein PilM [Candidatus Daviesbacteria bacterium GW2011_GWA1_41_61]|uniref:Type IV pilus assembly protein PilM n=1 Tax=Candidatus Daviesbacteria bacterium GW2011_GWA2_40_9 TaxID=1618424 RepID=A0A0G0U425_9BACT|nr:MAG: Type IV pilus assembly protein PilM [Candidatus Daviesbacteria bacterium GW2011_GWC1_40_9]KKR83843.1 MAG: type IV pilus assembly protein PilM [Candidatus Daviesbacteria bacterium GW2011_GWA2_40_9]KKR93452.1 MAG: type IV pilus assembly protein PilM [Candidatus Daviesbacteria bacterium GW2011_GWB1_41_15]KKS14999.1 MAG: type IV pilus assembly protein PilM [Candidatus Daviesbacteria bacterium GW2011_GWA1_41_61]